MLQRKQFMLRIISKLQSLEPHFTFRGIIDEEVINWRYEMRSIWVMLLALVAMITCVSALPSLLLTGNVDKNLSDSVIAPANTSLPLIEGAWYGSWNPEKIEGNTTVEGAYYGGWNPEKIEGNVTTTPAYYGGWDPMKIEGSRDY